MSRFEVTFRKDEEHLHQHLKTQEKPGVYLKNLIEKDMANPPDLYNRIFGDIERDYGTMHRFLQICGIEAVRNRLNTCTKAQRELLTEHLKVKHPELKNL